MQLQTGLNSIYLKLIPKERLCFEAYQVLSPFNRKVLICFDIERKQMPSKKRNLQCLTESFA